MLRRSIATICSICSVLCAVQVAGAAGRYAGPTVKFVLDDGAKISDVSTIVAKATPEGDVGIEKVEFAVNDQLKATDQSTPYSFDWDTLEEKEGAYTITATAFDAKGRTARAKLTVTIDNELGKGADAHADSALAAVKEGDVAKASRYAKRALKIDAGNFRAARALSGIYRANGDLNNAVATLARAEMPEKEMEARRELIALHIVKAEEASTTEEFLTECSAAGEVWKKVATLQVEEAKAAATTPEGKLALGDAHFAAHDYVSALRAYQSVGGVDSAPVEALGRQVLAQLRAGKLKEANALLAQMVRAKKVDQSTLVLQGLAAVVEHQFDKARGYVQDGVDTGSLPASIVQIYALLPLRKDRDARELVDKIKDSTTANADVLLAMALAERDPVDSRRMVTRALAVDPMLVEAYTLYAFHIMLGRDLKRFEAADAILDYALKLEPNNLYALMAKVACLQAQKRPQEAEPLLAQLLTLDYNSPDVHVSQALNLSLLDRTLKITEHMNLALKLDPERWNDVFVPQPGEMPLKIYRYRYQPVLSPSTLYPARQ